MYGGVYIIAEKRAGRLPMDMVCLVAYALTFGSYK